MRLLKIAIDGLFFFILFLVVTGGFVLHLETTHEISSINYFVVILWGLISIYFLLRKYTSGHSLEELLPFKITDFLIKKSEESLESINKFAVILAAVFASLLMVCSIFKYFSFNAYMWDLGFFDNLLWNTSQGNFYKVSTTF